MSINFSISSFVSFKLNFAEGAGSIPEPVDSDANTTAGTSTNPVNDAIIVDSETDDTINE